MDTVTLTRDKLFKMNISNTESSASSSPAPSRTPTGTAAPSPFAQSTRGQDQKGSEWIQDRNKEKSKLVDGIRNDSLLRKKDEGDRAPRPRSKNKDHVTCHRCQCTGHYAAECTAPAPAPRSGSKEPPRDGDRGFRGQSGDRNRGQQGTGGPGMEKKIEQHLMGQGTPAQVARIDTATITLYITMRTARG